MKLQHKITIVYLSFMLISIFNFGIFITNDQSAEATAINVAGRQRMLSQKMMKEALLLSRIVNTTEKKKAIENFMESKNLFSRSISSLINGGKTDLGQIRGVRSENSRKAGNELEGLWSVFDGLSEVVARGQIASPEIQNAITQMIPLSMELLASAHKLTVALNKDSLDKARRIWVFQFVGNILVIALIIVAILFINIPMFRRIEEVAVLAEKYSEGFTGRMPPEKISGKDGIVSST